MISFELVGSGKIIWNDPALDYVFYSWEGPVGRWFKGRARRHQALATMSAGIQSGALRNSIDCYFTRRGKALEVRVGANPGPGGTVGYALYHHEGTEPHVIRPVKAKALAFRYKGRMVYAKTVHHPGTKPNPYLTMWMNEVYR